MTAPITAGGRDVNAPPIVGEGRPEGSSSWAPGVPASLPPPAPDRWWAAGALSATWTAVAALLVLTAFLGAVALGQSVMCAVHDDALRYCAGYQPEPHS